MLAGDGKERPLLRRFGFRRQVSASVRPQWKEGQHTDRREETTMSRSTMRRIVFLALTLLIAPLVTDAQRVGKGVRLGVLSARQPRAASNWVAFEQRVHEL